MTTNINTPKNKSSLDVDKLEKALDNTKNESIMNFTTKKLREMILKILKELELPRNETIELMKKLKDYKYVDEMNDLKTGTYIRWINITVPENLDLNKGAIFTTTNVTDKGVFIVCKTVTQYKSIFFQLKLEENLIFQKLTTEELVLLSALDHLAT